MSEPTNAELKQLITDILSKVTAVEGEVSLLKLDQARLHVAVNNVQSAQHDIAESSGSGPRDTNIGGPTAASPTASHKLCFPKFDGSTYPVAWTHRCEQFFRAARTAYDENVRSSIFTLIELRG